MAGNALGVIQLTLNGTKTSAKVYEDGTCITETGSKFKLPPAKFEKFKENLAKIKQTTTTEPVPEKKEPVQASHEQSLKKESQQPEVHTQAGASILGDMLKNDKAKQPVKPRQEKKVIQEPPKVSEPVASQNTQEERGLPPIDMNAYQQATKEREKANQYTPDEAPEIDDASNDIEIDTGAFSMVPASSGAGMERYTPVRFISDDASQYKPATQNIKSFDAAIYLSSAYDKRAHKGSFAYYIVPRENEKKRCLSECGLTDNEFEYAIYGAVQMFKDIMRNNIREVIIVVDNELTKNVLIQNAMNIQDGWGETRKEYVNLMRNHSGVDFTPKFAVMDKSSRNKRNKSSSYMDIVTALAKNVLYS